MQQHRHVIRSNITIPKIINTVSDDWLFTETYYKRALQEGIEIISA
jgi:hypothetical protein